MTRLSAESSGLLYHLLLDRAIKGGIVLVALVLLVVGMVVIWRRTGPGDR
ncbi:hypothetical protein ITI46_24630 [Streptomyces oryzae]|uniref:Uncharacterized protein n=1 Tax=Streptomyces oryzae TaxID=1434886 RepID=A0ABS3XHD2_9ACTN|nr:hypothetical protein [Streptomyces oryzae]MBO8194817.1 hypothetical protein [Streptomyces oryzae]